LSSSLGDDVIGCSQTAVINGDVSSSREACDRQETNDVSREYRENAVVPTRSDDWLRELHIAVTPLSGGCPLPAVSGGVKNVAAFSSTPSLLTHDELLLLALLLLLLLFDDAS
jgi:hypothetical protein